MLCLSWLVNRRYSHFEMLSSLIHFLILASSYLFGHFLILWLGVDYGCISSIPSSQFTYVIVLLKQCPYTLLVFIFFYNNIETAATPISIKITISNNNHSTVDYQIFFNCSRKVFCLRYMKTSRPENPAINARKSSLGGRDLDKLR
jgi:hypothetical protein